MARVARAGGRRDGLLPSRQHRGRPVGSRQLARDSGVDDARTEGFGGIETFYGGYAGCFTDPDGHVWEIAHNPGFPRALTVPSLSRTSARGTDRSLMAFGRLVVCGSGPNGTVRGHGVGQRRTALSTGSEATATPRGLDGHSETRGLGIGRPLGSREIPPRRRWSTLRRPRLPPCRGRGPHRRRPAPGAPGRGGTCGRCGSSRRRRRSAPGEARTGSVPA